MHNASFFLVFNEQESHNLKELTPILTLVGILVFNLAWKLPKIQSFFYKQFKSHL